MPSPKTTDLLSAGGILGGIHRVYTVKRAGTYFAAGSGRVRADLNRLEVLDATPAPGSEALVLRFHHMEELRCRAAEGACRVEKAELPGDAAGFIDPLFSTGAHLAMGGADRAASLIDVALREGDAIGHATRPRA